MSCHLTAAGEEPLSIIEEWSKAEKLDPDTDISQFKPHLKVLHVASLWSWPPAWKLHPFAHILSLCLVSLTLSPNHLTRAVLLMLPFLLQTIGATPEERLCIFISVTSSSASHLFLSPAISNPNSTAGLSAALRASAFIPADPLITDHT